ncbi:response regulator [Natronohydrobacter thiooxidans]|jgi:CheY-like chemotaxis protein|uniref:response regulator n=1 Tax=Natronohydrobacter thiooxidans TaxID=87172 RepID=UPI000A0764DA|nr:response regulator [Natronohydrobacter thiooxidans]
MTTTHTRPAAAGRLPLNILSRPYHRGGTMLLIEDSRQTCDSIRLMFQGAGGRMRRADSLKGARRHLSLYTPDAVLVDLGLPDGSGLELIAEMTAHPPRVPLIIAISGQPELEAAALTAGADAFVAKPFDSIAQFRNLLAPVFFPLHAASAWPDMPPRTTLALRDDLFLALDLLCGRAPEDRRGYALQFTATLARSLGDVVMAEAVHEARLSGNILPLITHLRRLLADQPLI